MNTTLTPPQIPNNAPFSQGQISWLNGFLAGMYPSSSNSSGNSPDTITTPATKVTVIWGSQTGNIEVLAKQVSKGLTASGFVPNVIDAADYDRSKLANEELLLVLTSTYGEGEPPDNFADFHSWLLNGDAPRIEKTRYSVLAIGDSNYPDFCKCGLEVDQRLKALGGKEILARVDCDIEFEEPFENWLQSISTALGSSQNMESDLTPANDVSIEYGKKNPFPAKISLNRNLNGDGSAKETRHIEISIEGSGFDYAAGDALAVVPENCSLYIEELLEACGFNGHEEIISQTRESEPLREVLRKTYDISNLSLKVAKSYSEIAKDKTLTELISDREAFKKYAWGRQIIDLLHDFPVKIESPDLLLSMFSKLSPRLYSISSSPKAHPGEVHVTVGVVRYESHERERKGVCSSFLAEHEGQDPVGVFFHHTKTFKLPAGDSRPVIMVGPGTGIAPFRAFLEERSARKAEGKNWLFFGGQHASVDFLYKDEIETYFTNGLLTRFDTAFSRDQAEKIYVQDRMREHGEELYSWLEEGAYFYVCGDASRMAKDVDQTLHDLVAEFSGQGDKHAADYIKSLKKEKRYLRDVY